MRAYHFQAFRPINAMGKTRKQPFQPAGHSRARRHTDGQSFTRTYKPESSMTIILTRLAAATFGVLAILLKR